jgi:5-methylcytosine-specific restriction endonuclease McrBC regulatory subunit McrC
LKEEHRRDIHQIMAYSGFSSKSNKQGILCYPSSKLELREIIYESSLSKSSNVIHIIGLPLEVDSLKLGRNMIVNNLNLFNKIA